MKNPLDLTLSSFHLLRPVIGRGMVAAGGAMVKRWHCIAALALVVLPVARAATLSDSAVDEYNYRMSVQNIGGTYPAIAPTGNPLLDGANEVLAMGSKNYKFTMAKPKPLSQSPGYNIVLPPGITNLKTLARDEPQHRAMFDLPGMKNYVFWCYTFANPENWNWNGGLTAARRTAEYNEIYALCQYFLTQYNGTGKTFYLGNWEGDWSAGLPYSAVGNLTPTAIQGMIDWANIRQQAVDDAKANTPHSNVNCYYYIEVNRVVDAVVNPATSNQRVINKVVPFVPNLDFVSWSAYDIQKKSAADIQFYLNYAETQLPPAKAATIPGKRLFIGEYGHGELLESVQVPKNQAFNQILFDWGCPFSFYWDLSDNGFEADGTTVRYFDYIDKYGNKTPLYALNRDFLNNAKLLVLAFVQSHGGALPTPTEYAALVHPLLDSPIPVPVALTVNNLPAANIINQSATLSGNLIQGLYGDDCARVYVCWGTGDGGTVQANWQNMVDLGLNQQAGTAVFTTNLTNLASQGNYYFRVFASNAGGTVWAPATSSFTTRDSYTFTPTTSGTFAWSSPVNWDGHGVPLSSMTAGLTLFQDTTAALGSGSHVISGDPAILTLNAITLNGLGAAATGPATVDLGTTGNTWTLAGTTPTVNLNGNNNAQALTITCKPNLTLNQNTSLAGNGSAGFTFSGAITGGFSLTKSGTSKLTLSGANAFSGGLFVREGTVTCNTTSAFGSGTIYLGDTTGSASATLCGFSSPTTTSNPIVVQAGNAGMLTIRNPSFGSTNFLGNLTLNQDVKLDGGTSSIGFSIFRTGSLSGSGNITVESASGGATVILQHAGSSGYTGSVVVNNGTLRLASAAALNSTNTVQVNSGTTLDVRSNVTIAGLNDNAGAGGTVINNNGGAGTRILTLGGAAATASMA